MSVWDWQLGCYFGIHGTEATKLTISAFYLANEFYKKFGGSLKRNYDFSLRTSLFLWEKERCRKDSSGIMRSHLTTWLQPTLDSRFDGSIFALLPLPIPVIESF
ncbi:MAG: hypothetical protein V7K48_24305 [Nostoc sp.]|uniref:hypothetical protein n=1 Tax=Nostoc sp. TaxID=1180 RepID=UPI002FFC0D91